MARHCKQLTPEANSVIIKLSQQGLSSRKIEEITGYNTRTFSKHFKRFPEPGNIENRPRIGQRPKTTKRSDSMLFRMVKRNRRQTLSELTSEFNLASG